MAITIKPDVYYNELIIDTFNNKEKLDENILLARNQAILSGYDYEGSIERWNMALFTTDDAFYKDIIEGLLYKAASVEFLGEITVHLTHYDGSGLLDTATWLIESGMTDASIVRDSSEYWYTNPVAKQTPPDLTLKPQVLANIEENNALESKYKFTKFDQTYLDTVEFNKKIEQVKRDILSKSRTSKQLSDIEIDLYATDPIKDMVIQWLKDCGFEDAHFEVINFSSKIKLA